MESKPETCISADNPKAPTPAPDKCQAIKDAHANLLDLRKDAKGSREDPHGTLIKFQDRNLPHVIKELGCHSTDVKDICAKVPCPVLTPKPLSIIPGCQKKEGAKVKNEELLQGASWLLPECHWSCDNVTICGRSEHRR
jgi:hypothetical protein